MTRGPSELVGYCRRDWVQISAAEWTGNQDRLAAAFERLKWEPLPVTLGMMPGEGIKAAIRELRIPRVSAVAVSSDLAPCGLYGIRGHYKNGRADIYLMDFGTHMQPLAVDFYTKAAPDGAAEVGEHGNE